MIERRSLLRGSIAAAALTATRPWSAAAAPRERNALLDTLEAWVPTYNRPWIPRGVQLSFDADPTSTRAVTWLTTGDPGGSVIQWGVLRHPRRRARRADLHRFTTGARAPAPFGWGDNNLSRFPIDLVRNPSSVLFPHRSPGNPRPGEQQVFVHRARLEGLPPGARVAYRVGDGHPERWSAIHTFDPTPTGGKTFRFTHLGDHGTTVASRRNTRVISERRPDWHLIAGDISYADGDQRVWDLWAEQVMPLGAVVPIMAAPGNHEAKDFMGETYRTRFSYPNHGKPWYSIDYGRLHLVSTPAGAFFGDVKTIAELVTEELLFLERALAQAAARRAAGEIDFIAVVQHFPTFTHHRTRGPMSPHLVIAQEHILQRYQIDLLLVAHDHMYQRSHPMAYGQPTPGGLAGYVQIIAGGGGQSLYEFADGDVSWLAARARRAGFVEYEVGPGVLKGTVFGFADGYDENAFYTGLNNVDPDLEPEVIDTFTLRRRPGRKEVPTAPRTDAQVLANVPEVLGVIRRNRAEDCTLHHHRA